MIVKDYFTKDEIIEVLRSVEDYGVADFEGLFDSMFNNDYYIIGTYEATEALETFKNDEKLDGYETALDGTFGAIELVKQYELDQVWGDIHTVRSNPEKLANIVEYIEGGKVCSMKP